MYTDAFTFPGQKHLDNEEPNQDNYCVGDNFVGVSDGCSGGIQTEIGARKWMDALDVCLGNPECPPANTPAFDALFLNTGKDLMRSGIPQNYWATAVMAIKQTKSVVVKMFGDGAFVTLHRNGTIHLYILDAPQNCPLYPAYLWNPDDLNQWITMTNGPMDLKEYQYNYDGDLLKFVQRPIMWKEGTPFTMELDASNLMQVMVCTDGILTIPNQQLFPMLKQLLEVNPSKNMLLLVKDELANEWLKKDVWPTDDFTVAQMYL